MAATNGRTVTVFGGTGFLGSHVVRRLRNREFNVRIASRHPDRGHRQFGLDNPLLHAERRLVLCNDRFLELFGLSRESAIPGMAARHAVTRYSWASSGPMSGE